MILSQVMSASRILSTCRPRSLSLGGSRISRRRHSFLKVSILSSSYFLFLFSLALLVVVVVVVVVIVVVSTPLSTLKTLGRSSGTEGHLVGTEGVELEPAFLMKLTLGEGKLLVAIPLITGWDMIKAISVAYSCFWLARIFDIWLMKC